MTLPHLLLSSTIAMASQVQCTFTGVYADYVQLQEEYARKCTEYDHIDCTLSSILPQIEGQNLFIYFFHLPSTYSIKCARHQFFLSNILNMSTYRLRLLNMAPKWWWAGSCYACV
jgi:hypothetical protein